MFGRQSLPQNLYSSILLVLGALALLMLVLTVAPSLQASQMSPYVESGNADLASASFDRARVNKATTSRLEGLAGQYVNLYGSTNWVRAPKEVDLARAREAEIARLNAVAEQYVNLQGSTNWVRASQPLDRAQAAEAARLSGLAGKWINLYGSTSWVRAQNQVLSRPQAADAARLTGLAIASGHQPDVLSTSVAHLLGE